MTAWVCSSRRVRREAESQLSGGGAGPNDIPGPAGSGSFTISFTAPTLDYEADAQPEMPGAYVQYGTDGTTFPYRKCINDASAGSITVSSLATDTYYCQIAFFYDSDLTQSSTPSPQIPIEKIV